ncbi:MAG: tyrosine-protein phosphatase [Planctomycetota bacterium]|jgi:protein tyrosine phosphatase (PTP) superfamily phosphohydrolase (DUF442 family)
MRTTLRIFARWCALALALTFCACANLGTVEEGRLYRSGQLDGETLAAVIEETEVRSVLNLRGESPDKLWYTEEVATCERLGIEHLNVRMRARRWPKTHEILALLDAFDAGPYPMILHCQGGADRSGLASAIFRMVHLDEDPEDADCELSALRYGHLGAVSGTSELGDFVELFQDTHRGKPFRRWVVEDYQVERDLRIGRPPSTVFRPEMRPTGP